MDPWLSDPKKIIAKMHSKLGQTSAHQWKRVCVDPDGETIGSANFADDASEQCGICRAFDFAPQMPIAGLRLSAFNGTLPVDLLLLDVYSRWRLLCARWQSFPGGRFLITVRFAQEVRGVLRSWRIAISGRPKRPRTDEGGA